MKLVLYLDDQMQKNLDDISRKMARDPVRQAYVILKNGIDNFLEEESFIGQCAIRSLGTFQEESLNDGNKNI